MSTPIAYCGFVKLSLEGSAEFLYDLPYRKETMQLAQ